MPEKSSDTSSIKKRFIKWTFRISGGFLFLVLLILFFLTLPPGESLIRNIARDQLSNILDRPVKISGLNTNLLSYLEVKDLYIPSAETDSSSDTLLNIKEVRVSYNLWALIHKNIRLKKINISGMAFYLQREADGSLNLPVLSSARQDTAVQDSAKGGFTVTIEEIFLEESEFSYQDVPAAVTVSLKSLGLEILQDEPDHYNIQMLAESGSTKYRSEVFNLNKLWVEGAVNPQSFQLDSLLLDLSALQLHGGGSLARSSTPAQLAGKFKISLDAQPVTAIFRNSIPDKFYPINTRIAGKILLGGDLDHPLIKTDLKTQPGKLGTDLAFRADIDLTYENTTLKLHHLNLNLFDGYLTARGMMKLDTTYEHDIKMSLQNISLQQLYGYLYQKPASLQGQINGTVSSQGPISNPLLVNISSNLEVNNFSYRSRSFPDFNLDVVYRDRHAGLDIRQGESQIRADIKINQERISGNYSADIPHIQPFLALAQVSGVTGKLKLEGTVTGRTDSPDISLSFNGNNIRYRNFPLDDITGSLDYQQGSLILHKTAFSGNITRIDTLEPPFDIKNLHGSLNYEGHISGTPEDPKGEVRISMDSLRYNSYAVDMARINVRLDSQEIFLQPGRIIRDSLEMVFKGNYHIPEASGNLAILLGPRNFSANFPDSLPGNLSDSRNRLAYGYLGSQFNLSDSLNREIQLSGKELSIAAVMGLISGGPPLGGFLNFSSDLRGNLSNPDVDLRFRVRSLQYKDALIDSARGKVAIQKKFAYLDSLKIFLNGQPSNIYAKVELQPDTSQALSVSKKSDILVKANGNDLDLRFLEPLIGEAMKVDGFLDYSLTAGGKLGNPEIRGKIKLTKGAFRLNPDTPGIDHIALNMEFKDSLFTLNDLEGKYQNTAFILQGNFITADYQVFKPDFTLKIDHNEAIKLHGVVSRETLELHLGISRFQIEPLQTFIPGVSGLKGELFSDITLSGSYDNPDVSGKLRLLNFEFQPQMLQEKIQNGQIFLAFDNNRVSIDSFRVLVDKGMVSITGFFEHQGLKLSDANINVSLQEVSIDKPDLFQLMVKAAGLKYHKTNNYFLLEGEVILGKSEIVRNIEPRDIIQSFQSVDQPAKEPPELFRQTKLNVQLRESENLWIDNNLAKLKLHAEMTLIGTLARPNITGRLSVEEGYVMYLDRKFQVETGILDFINPNTLNPVINLKTTSTVKVYDAQETTEYTVTLAVSGSMDQPVVDLTSDPPLDRSSILSLLTLGTPMENIALTSDQTGTSVADVLKSRAASLSSQKITGLVSRQVGNLLGLDRVRIEGNIFRFNETGGPQLVASKTFLDNFEVTYSTSVGHLNEQSIRLDYHISQHWSIQGQTDQRGESGLDLKYRLKFR